MIDIAFEMIKLLNFYDVQENVNHVKSWRFARPSRVYVAVAVLCFVLNVYNAMIPRKYVGIWCQVRL